MDDDRNFKKKDKEQISKNKRKKSETKKEKNEINVTQNPSTSATIKNLNKPLLHADIIATQPECDKIDTTNDVKLQSYTNKKETIHKLNEKALTNLDKDEKIKKKKTLSNLDKTTKKEKTIETKKKLDHDIRKAPELGLQNDSKLETQKIEHEIEDNTTRVAIKIKLCQNCNTHHVQDQCPLTYPNFVISDSIDLPSWQEKFQNLHEDQSELVKTEKEDDANKFIFANLSLPSFLQFLDTNTEHGMGVWAKVDIQEFTQFGPLIGKVVKEVDISEDSNMRDIWEICGENGNVYISTENLENSNWMRFVQPAPTRDDKNITVVTKENSLYFVSTKAIKNGEELLYWQDSAIATSKKKMEKTCKLQEISIEVI